MAEEKTQVKEQADQTEKKEVTIQPHNKVADFSDGGIYNSSDSFTLAMNMAKTLAGSTIVPPAFQKSWENCMVALSQSKKLGVDPFVVMNNMYLIQGKITWKSEFIIAMINASGKFDTELQYEEEEKDGKPYACTAYTFKDGRKISGIRVTMDMANAEGWTKKNGTKWTSLTQLMLRYRAAVFFARFNAPELTSGLYTVEEGEDVTFNSNTPHKIKKSTSLNEIVEDENIVDGEVVSEG